MFVLTTLVYPVALAALCLGAGLLVDGCSGRWLPEPLLLPVGAATLIGISQLSTYASALAPATPYIMAALALAGFALAERTLPGVGAPGGEAPSRGVRGLARRALRRPWLPIASLLVYLIALAPVLLAGRASFSSFMALADSAVHMMGADFLMRHGQDYSHLDLRNSYGQFLNAYYNTSYPSGADTLFGGSAFLLHLPLIWAFQPFNAFVLATATGPAWLLARRLRLDGALAALAALTALLGALVYAYALLASVKELTALAMILTLGALAVGHERWLRRGPAAAIPLAVVLAAGVSALGVAFGAWALAAVAVLAVIVACDVLAGRQTPRQVFGLAAVAAIVLVIGALPTWTHVSGSLTVAQNIASTSNSGNLHTPLRATQVFGVWLGGSYKLSPAGAALSATQALIAVMLIAAVLGAAHVLRARAYALAGWLACMLLVWLGVSEAVTTWAGAKTLMLTSPVLALLAWGGVAALRAHSTRALAGATGLLLALVIAGGALASDVLQYRSSNLAPTARYEELASLNSRFAGGGPTLFADFDEYALYELRDLDIGGPDFVYPPAALAAAAGGYGDPVDLDRARPDALLAYPLIITRRDPASSRPPAAYSLIWQGAYYQVWRRAPAVTPPVFHRALTGSTAAQCSQIAHEAEIAKTYFAPAETRLMAAEAPELVRISLAGATHPRRWGHQRAGLVMSSAGRLSAGFQLPAGGAWLLWIQGQIMPTVGLSLDGRPLASIGGQLSGNSLVPDTVPPIPVRLAAGSHNITVTRRGATLAPGDGGSAVLDAIFLTPASSDPAGRLRITPSSRWSSLCGRRYYWIEISRG
jgi:hypothetical protein